MRGISVVPYDPKWPLMYESERSLIIKALGDNCFCIHHIGSTSIPGLSSKPIIDILVASKDRELTISSLEAIGYKYYGEWNIPFQLSFTKRGEIDVNMHLFLDPNHPEIEFNLKFRDYLRNHPTIRDEYSQLKLNIIKDENSNTRPTGGLRLYTIRKGPFIENVMRSLGYNRLHVLKANTESQWEAVKSFSPHHQIILDDHEHLVFYRGVDIVGYVDIKLKPEPMKVVASELSDVEARPFFDDFIKKRLELPVSLHV